MKAQAGCYVGGTTPSQSGPGPCMPGLNVTFGIKAVSHGFMGTWGSMLGHDVCMRVGPSWTQHGMTHAPAREHTNVAKTGGS
jgi:hypothetical protein